MQLTEAQLLRILPNARPVAGVFVPALNRAMQLVAASVKGAGVTVVMFNPGPTLTEHQMYLKDQFKGMLETSFTVGNMIKTIDGVTIKDTGKFLRYDGVAEAW